MKVKKNSIGYNTVTSVDGIISTRGVKSKPNNIQIFGYTHEIGEGEKSPDNPYQLVSLDSGNMSVNGVEYEHSITLTNNNTTIQVPTSVPLYSVEGVSDYIFKDIDGIWKLMQNCQKYEFTGDESFSIQSTNAYGIVNFVYDLKIPATRDIKSICSHYANQVTLIANTTTTGYTLGNKNSTNSTVVFFRISNEILSTTSELKAFLLGEYNAKKPVTILYKVRIPIIHVLSDYAQELLNSFVLENKNNISVEGNPTFKITGYLQK